VTNLAVAQVNNPGTPNGGLYARFAPILNLFGIEAVSQGGTSASSTGIALNAATVGLALGYNLMSDFPVTLNPFSLTNSLLATVLPTNLIGGATLAGTSDDVIYAKLGALATLNLPSTTYGTLAPTDLPLLEPLRLPARLVNAAFQALGVPITVPTPLADALQPAAEILVNVGYTDVQTPSEGGTYNRTYDQSGTYTPYLSVNPLTPAEWAQVPGDVVRALVGGFASVFAPRLAPPVAATPSVRAATVAAPAIAVAPTNPAALAADVADLGSTVAAVTPRQFRGASVQQPQSRGGARVATNRVKAAGEPKRAAAARSVRPASD
jgi:hypothetical protein